VVRFTGRTAREDVVELSHEIAERSGVLDVKDIPVGFEIKVPLELLEPEFLPADHPRRTTPATAGATWGRCTTACGSTTTSTTSPAGCGIGSRTRPRGAW
jgi:hypothetical protein